MRSVVRLSVAPVKGLALQHPRTVRVERYGVLENRRFYLAEEDGRLFNGARGGRIMTIRSEYDPTLERLVLRFPDGSQVEGDATATGAAMQTSFYGRPVAGCVLEGRWEAALSDYVGRPVHLVRTDAPGDANDEVPVSISTTASAQELARRSGKPQALDSRRFRMLVEVSGGEPHEEETWLDRRVRIGDVVVAVVALCGRCVVTTLDPDTGLKDLDTLEELRAYRLVTGKDGVNFGVYADVVEPGEIRVGDAVEPDPA